MVYDHLKAALYYANHFPWPVLPLYWPKKCGKDAFCSCKRGKNCTNIGKHPLWHENDLPHGAHSATTDAKLITRWWKRWPQANVGIATGRCFDVLDVDVTASVDGRETLSDFERKYSKLPETIEQITGGGGRQILFMTNAKKLKNAVKFAPGLDVRTLGGLIVVPPSLHASGKRYEWELSSRPGDVALAAMPTWLTKQIMTSSQPSMNRKRGWETELLRGVKKDFRNHTATRLTGFYLNRGLNPDEVLLLLTGWNMRNIPPLDQDELTKTVQSIVISHENKTGDQDARPHKITISIG